MKKGKLIREKGKLRLSEYFKQINKGDRVAVVREASINSNFPSRIIGLTGKITGEKGRYKIVEIMDGKMKKSFIIHPIHLKLIKTQEKKKK